MKPNQFYEWVFRVSYIYLAIPFIIFSVSWLNVFAGVIFATLVIWATYLVLQKSASKDFTIPSLQSRTLLLTAIILFLWILLSGIGGYMFQNWDHHWRNALFRDLITYEWPVIYSTPDGSGSNIMMLTYNIGFWLPAATIGKALGWEIANVTLFLWSWLGVVLVGLLLQYRFRSQTIFPIILLIFFSGIDFIGMFLRQRIAPLSNFSFWLPIHRLENWTTLIQYSSNTTQLFWIFNQAIPSWLCITLMITTKNKKNMFFLWSLCFFNAPIQAISILPFMLLEVIKNAKYAHWKDMVTTLKQYINPANVLGGGSILLISYLYFTQSVVSFAGETASFNIVLYSVFFILEGGLLWILIYPGKRDYQWLLIGTLLLIGIFLHNDTYDFGEKITNTVLFMLMIVVGDFLFQQRKSAINIIVVIMLALGSITAFYEISRSVIKTSEYYTNSLNPGTRWNNDVNDTYPILTPELSFDEVWFHPHSLLADDIKTFNTPVKAKWTSNYLGEATNSMFYQYFAQKR